MIIRGIVNPLRYAQVQITVRGAQGAADKTLDAIMDTGFDQGLSLPLSIIKELNLYYSRKGSSMNFGCEIEEFDAHYAVAVLGDYEKGVVCFAAENPPLVGMELLDGFRLCVDNIPK